MTQDGADPAQLFLATELQALKDQRMVEKGNIRRKYMGLLKKEKDLDSYTRVEDKRNKELKVVDASFDAKERALKEDISRGSFQPSVVVTAGKEKQEAPAFSSTPHSSYSQPSVVSSASASAPARVPTPAPPPSNKLPSQDASISPGPLARVPSVEVRSLFTNGRYRLMATFISLVFQGLPRGQKRRASAEPAAFGEPKRPRLEDAHHVHEDAHHSHEAGQERTTTYGDVRRRAKENGWWDTIVEFPSGSQKWYILYCEEHGINFKQGAVHAAAKHLNGSLHGFSTRNQEVAIKVLGHRIVGCTVSLAKEHNLEVDNAFKNGYVPRRLERKERKVKDSPRNVKNEAKESSNDFEREVNSESLLAYTSPRNASKSKAKIIDPPLPRKKKGVENPKPFHIYYCEFLEVDEDDKTHTSTWPVVILGWDDLQPGAMRHEKLVDTGLLDQKNQPPGCYVYSDRKDKILGWKMGTNNKPRHKGHERKFPVMFFDDGFSYAWASATDLSKFPLDRKNAPKVRGYKEKSFNEARDFIARREGYRCWADREAARTAGQLKKWYPGMPRLARSDEELPLVWPENDREAEVERSPSPRPASISDGMSGARKLAEAAASPDVPHASPDVPHASPDIPHATSDIPYAPPDLPELQAESPSSAFELRPGTQKFTAKRTKRHQQRDSASTAGDYQFAMTPAETPTPIASPATEFPAIDLSAARFELSQYGADNTTYWSRSSPESDGIKLYEAGGRGSVLQTSQGSAINVEIDAAVWEFLDLEGVAGNTQITLRGENKSIQIMFDRKQGDVKTSKGKIQARDFVDWLRDTRKQLGLELRTG